MRHKRKFEFNKAINEAASYGVGFSGPSGSSGSTSSTGQPYCEYRILPLSHNLEQKGNTNKDTNIVYISIGNKVSGKCVYDNKIHYGTITRLFVPEGSVLVSLVYILDENSQIVPLYPETIKIKK